MRRGEGGKVGKRISDRRWTSISLQINEARKLSAFRKRPDDSLERNTLSFWSQFMSLLLAHVFRFVNN